jgi:hypothetical protein
MPHRKSAHFATPPPLVFLLSRNEATTRKLIPKPIEMHRKIVYTSLYEIAIFATTCIYEQNWFL